MSEEWMAESETGGRKGQKLARYDLIPTMPLKKLAEQYGRGATKYEDRNWEKGYNWSLSYAAAQRHLNTFWGGRDWDEDWPDNMEWPHHLDAAIFHLMALREFIDTHPEFDDRPKTTKNPTSRASDPTARILAGRKQAESTRPVSPVQTRRWELP